MTLIEKKSMDKPDDFREVPGASLAMTAVGGMDITLARNDPGWSWSKSLKPLMGTELCEVPHTFYQVSGHLHVKMADGTEEIFGPGDVGHIEPGHDAWVVGDEPSVAIHVNPEIKEVAQKAGS